MYSENTHAENHYNVICLEAGHKFCSSLVNDDLREVILLTI